MIKDRRRSSKPDEISMFSVPDRTDRFFKIVSIISFCLILLLLAIILQVGPASTYEFSIYDAYPWYFWFFLLSVMICGQIIILGSAVLPSKNNNWILGLCPILIIDALLVFMPVIRGYYSYDEADVLTHIGYMKDILLTSNIGGDQYPVDHLLGVIIHLFSGLSLPDATLIIPPVFSFFLILSLYLIGKTMFKNKFELLLLVVVSSILVLGRNHVYFTPNAQALLLVPLIVFLAFKMYQGENFKKYNFLLLLVSSLIIFYHPLVTVMVIIILTLMQFTQYILEKWEKRTIKKVNFTYTIFFIILVFSLWSTYLSLATHTLEPIIDRIFFGGTSESQLASNVNLLSQVNVDVFYIIRLIFNIYGQWILLGIVSLLCIGFILLLLRNQKIKPDFYKGSLMAGFLALSVLSVVMLIINGSFGFERVYAHATLFSLLLIPTGAFYFIYNSSEEKSLNGKKILKLLGMVIVIFGITYFSTFNLYYSPIIKAPNLQVPKSDYTGMSTFFSYRNVSVPHWELGLASFRFYDAIYGISARYGKFNETYLLPPIHFGYQNATLSAGFYNGSKYLLMNDQGRELNPRINPEFPSRWTFRPEDFERLKSDNKVQQVYANGDLGIFMVM